MINQSMDKDLKAYELASINRARKEAGLRPLRLSKVSCLRCGILFETYNRFNNRLCKKCKDSNILKMSKSDNEEF